VQVIKSVKIPIPNWLGSKISSPFINMAGYELEHTYRDKIPFAVEFVAQFLAATIVELWDPYAVY
jgi:hypothetical protein